MQELSIRKHLSEYMAYCSGQTENPDLDVEKILPGLKRLSIYEELSVLSDPDCRARDDENMAVRASDTVETMYEETQDTELDLCYFIFPEREYTIIRQLLMGNGFVGILLPSNENTTDSFQVCLATLAPGLTFKDFVYGFIPEYEAFLSDGTQEVKWKKGEKCHRGTLMCEWEQAQSSI